MIWFLFSYLFRHLNEFSTQTVSFLLLTPASDKNSSKRTHHRISRSQGWGFLIIVYLWGKIVVRLLWTPGARVSQQEWIFASTFCLNLGRSNAKPQHKGQSWHILGPADRAILPDSWVCFAVDSEHFYPEPVTFHAYCLTYSRLSLEDNNHYCYV